MLRSSFQKLQAESGSRRTNSAALAASTASPWWQSRWQFFLPNSLRMLMHKEWRVFRRDPVQWLQFVVFFGLLILYLVNLKRFQTQEEHATMIGFLNLAVVGLILSTFTTRFIFPMISLEGRRFWILNLLPIDRGTILYSKFLFAAFGAWFPCALLIYLSDSMLDLPDWIIGIHQLACIELCLGLAGMAVGLGALLVDLREQTPAKIAAGFGGTLNLVGSALFILISVLISAVPAQLKVIQDRGMWQFQNPWVIWAGTRDAILYSQLFNITFTVVVTWGAMRLGVQSFRKQDF
jgi:ABC-2 type transport system permease protein